MCIYCETAGDIMPASLELNETGDGFRCLACGVDDSSESPATYESMMAEIAQLPEVEVEALYDCEDRQDIYLTRLAHDAEEAVKLALEFDNVHAAHEIMRNDPDVENRLYLCRTFNLTEEDCDAAFADREHAAYVNGIPYR